MKIHKFKFQRAKPLAVPQALRTEDRDDQLSTLQVELEVSTEKNPNRESAGPLPLGRGEGSELQPYPGSRC